MKFMMSREDVTIIYHYGEINSQDNPTLNSELKQHRSSVTSSTTQRGYTTTTELVWLFNRC